MKIYILRKSITDLKVVDRRENETSAATVGELIRETVEKNYAARPIRDSLDECVQTAFDEFCDGGFYIVNVTKNIKYRDVDEVLNISEGDELVFIKLKYLRGLIW